MPQIEGTRDPSVVEDRASLASFPPRDQIKARVEQIDADIATLSGLAQTPQVAILTRTLRNQKHIIRNLAVFVYQTPAGQE